MQHPVGSVSLWCLTLNKQTCVLLFQITFSFILLTFHRDTCCVVLGCTKVFQPLVRQFFLLPDYKTCICRGNFLLSREFRRQFPDNLWRGPHWGNVASWVSSTIVLCGVILRKWPHAVIIIDASPLSLSSSWMTQSQVDFGAKYDTRRIEWRAHLINLHHGIIFNLMGRHVFLPFLQKTGG